MLRFKFEKEFRKAHPETIGEKDKNFDLDTYAMWLEEQIESIPIEPPVKPEIAEITWLNPEEKRPKHGDEIICTNYLGVWRGIFETTRDGLVKIEGKATDIIYWEDVYGWLPYPKDFE